MIINRFNDVPYQQVADEIEDLLADHVTTIDPSWLRFRPLRDMKNSGYYCGVYVNLQDVPLRLRRTVAEYARERGVYGKVVITEPLKLTKSGRVQLLYVTLEYDTTRLALEVE